MDTKRFNTFFKTWVKFRVGAIPSTLYLIDYVQQIEKSKDKNQSIPIHLVFKKFAFDL